MTCSQCNKDVEVNSSYCRFCGAAIRAGTLRQLKRLASEGKIAGVCAGLAEYFDMDVTLVRLAWIGLSIVPGVLIGGLLAYAVAWLFVPESHRERIYEGKQLQRSNSDKMIAGVCGGIAEYLRMDSTIVRALWVVVSIYPGAVIGGALAYLIAWAVIPAPRQAHLVSTTA